MTPAKCFACLRVLKQPKEVWTSDPQMQWVGPECYKKIVAAGEQGYQPAIGGPRLFANIEFATKEE